MRRPAILFTLLAILAAGQALAAFPFWLDSPRFRDNPHDPKSPLWRATLVPVPPTLTFTRSPTLTLTFTASPPHTATATPTRTLTVTGTSSPSATATASPTMTVSPSPTITPTPSISPMVYFDGDTPGAQIDSITRFPFGVTPVAVPGGSSWVVSAQTSAGGSHAGFQHNRVNLTTLGAPIMGGVGGIAVDVSSYQALSLWLRSQDGCFDPVVSLHSPGSIQAGTSAAVTASAYTVDGGAMDAGVWRHVVIPLSAFDGVNDYGQPYNLAANGHQVSAVSVAPSFPRNYLYFSGGPFWVFRAIPPGTYDTSIMDMDDVQFQALPPLALKTHSQVFDAFVSPDGISGWNSTWSTFIDSLTCLAPNSSFSFPAPGGFPVDVHVSPLNACYSGHISGTYGAAAGSPPCGPSDYSVIGMVADFSPSGAPLDFAASGLRLTSGQVKGMSFYLKKGPGSAAIDYAVILRKASVAALNDAAHYRHLVTDAQISGGAWTHFQVDFPTAGLPGTDFAGSFGQPAWAAGAGASVNWDTTDMLSIQIVPDDSARGQDFDIYVGQIKFY